MTDADSGLDIISDISSSMGAFKSERGSVSEADTRAKIIDRVLKEVLQWPEECLSREDHVESGFTDYTLRVHGRPYVAVEAKREARAFALPIENDGHRNLRIDGALTTDHEVKAAVNQVRTYCDDGGIRYAIATNGYSWIVFRAISEEKPWRKGSARVFTSFDDIVANFTDFWNLLSYPAIARGSLDDEFGAPNRTPRQLLRVLERLFNADLPLQRNRLHAQLHPLLSAVFENIADQDTIDILQSCYVHSNSLRIVADDLNVIITDAIPQFLLDQGARPASQSDIGGGRFGIALANAMPTRHGQLFLLLGGIGSGKTTFIKRYQRTVGAPLLNRNSLWFHVDFLEAPPDVSEMESFVWTTVLKQLRTRYTSPHLETRRNIKHAFADKIVAIEHTGLRGLRAGSDLYENALSPFLARWQEGVAEYVPALLSVGREARGVEIVVFIDNVDQLSPLYQGQIFLLAQRITRSIGSITVVSLREESYYAANLQRTLTAYTNRKFHIASPRFRKLIGNRLRFALKSLDRDTAARDIIIPEGMQFDADAIGAFLRIVESSVFEHNKNIARFIESLCFGNMRMALEMFTTFLVSGATDVGKMLAIYRREGAYFVAFHEFVKSIMLGDRKYYKEEASPVMNLFDCSTDRNSGHFTSLRVLRFLLSRRGETSTEGQGYCEIARLIALFEDVFDNRVDVVRTLNRLVARQVVEVNTRSPETIEGASHVRVTSAGWYYSRFLAGLFPYLDLVLQDTPLNDTRVEAELRHSVFLVDNLADREDEKLQRMQVRFERVARFLAYLQTEEENEHVGRDLAARGVVGERIVPGLLESFRRERTWIEGRLRYNRERFAEDLELISEADAEREQLEQASLFDDDSDEAEKAVQSGALPEAPHNVDEAS